MNLCKTLSLFLTACYAFSITAVAQISSGKLSLHKGEKLEVDNDVKSVITQEMMGQSMEVNINALMVHHVEVKEKKDSSFTIVSTLTKLKTKGSAMGQKLDFDSDKKEDMESETGKAIKDELNVAKEIELNESAKVINTKKPNKNEEKTSGSMIDIFKNITGDDADESNGAKDAFEVIPTGKKKGDIWADSIIIDDVKTYRKYKIKEVKDNDATIVLSGTQITDKKMEQQGLEINIHMEGKLSGEGIVDMSTGIITQKSTVMDATGTAEVMGQSVPVTSKVTSVTTVKRL